RATWPGRPRSSSPPSGGRDSRIRPVKKRGRPGCRSQRWHRRRRREWRAALLPPPPAAGAALRSPRAAFSRPRPGWGSSLSVSPGWFSVPAQIEPDKHAVGVGHVTDQAPQRRRQLFDECGRRDDLLAARQGGMLVDVDDLECAAVLQMLVANLAQIADRCGRTCGKAGDVEPQQITPTVRRLGFLARRSARSLY